MHPLIKAPFYPWVKQKEAGSGLRCLMNCLGCCGNQTMKRFAAMWKLDINHYDNTRSRELLGIEYLSIEQTAIAHAFSLQDYGMLPEDKTYTGKRPAEAD